jgi:integrase
LAAGWITGTSARGSGSRFGGRGLAAGPHGFASLLIAKGLEVVFVSRQLGHANPTVTLGTYAHLFERADHAQAAREALEASYAALPSARGS